MKVIPRQSSGHRNLPSPPSAPSKLIGLRPQDQSEQHHGKSFRVLAVVRVKIIAAIQNMSSLIKNGKIVVTKAGKTIASGPTRSKEMTSGSAKAGSSHSKWKTPVRRRRLHQGRRRCLTILLVTFYKKRFKQDQRNLTCGQDRSNYPQCQ